MQLGQIRSFVAVAERRHFTRAARDLGIAQPSLSKQIRNLEDDLGTPLFHRTRGNVSLTPGGDALLPWARRIIADVEAGSGEVRELAGLRRGRVAIGATPSLTTALLPAAIARFRSRYPGIDIVLTEAGSGDLVRALDQGTLDLALVILPVRSVALETAPVFREELVVAVPRDHPLAQRRSVAIADLRDLPFVMFREGYDLRATTLDACRRAGFTPKLALEGGEMDGVLRMTAAGIGIAVVPSIVVLAEGALRGVRLAQPLARTIGFARRRDRQKTRAALELETAIRELLRSADWSRRVRPT